MMRDSLRFVSDDDRQCYRKGIRTLALVYGGILVLVVVVTALRTQLHTQQATAKAMAGAVSAADSAHSFSADLERERARSRQ